MKYKKDDLLAVKTLEGNIQTCVVVGPLMGDQYLYCYCIELDEFRLIYYKEVDFVITEGFRLESLRESGVYNLDYSFYEACAEMFSYSPFFCYPYDLPDEDESDDEDD